MNKKVLFGVVILTALISTLFFQNKKKSQKLQHIQGITMGVVRYNVKYAGTNEQLKPEIDTLLKNFNQSLSTYIEDSEISKLNKNGSITFKSSYFYPVLKESRDIYQNTFKAFDPTIGPLIQAWGFEKNKLTSIPDSTTVDSLLRITGMGKVVFDEKSVTLPKNMTLNFGAIAKGYAVDLVANFLEQKKINNYFVEIGGEIRAKGINQDKKTWAVGIEDPTVKIHEKKLFAVARLKDLGLATSGNYRNFYEKDGKLIAHIIDPRTGYNTNLNLLSVSVFAKKCLTADAYATAFMVLGLDGSKKVLDNHSELSAILIYREENGEIKTFISEKIKSYIELVKK